MRFSNKILKVMIVILSISVLFLGGCLNKKDKKEEVEVNGSIVLRKFDNKYIFEANEDIKGAEVVLDKKVDKSNIKSENLKIVKIKGEDTTVAVMNMDGVIKKGEKLFQIENTSEDIKIKNTTSVLNNNMKRSIMNLPDGLTLTKEAVIPGDPFSLDIIGKNIGEVTYLEFTIGYDSNLLELDTNLSSVVSLSDATSNASITVDDSISGEVSVIIDGALDIIEMNLASIHFIAKETAEGKTEIGFSTVSGMNSAGTINITGNPGGALITNPTLLGDFDNNNEVDLYDFEDFVMAYGLADSDTEYESVYDIDPEMDLFDGEWAGIFDYAEPDGKIDIFDFEVFVHNFGEVIVMNTSPTAPENNYPMNGATGINADEVMLMWNESSDSDGDQIDYEAFYRIKGDPSEMTSAGVTTETSIMVKGLQYEMTYEWKVIARDGQSESIGDTWEFTTGPEMFPAYINEDFETGDFSKYKWEIFSYYEDDPEVVSGQGIDGSNALELNIGETSDVNEITINVEVPESTYVIFEYRFSSASMMGDLTFDIDYEPSYEPEERINAEDTLWHRVTVPLTVGEHELEWQYDNSDSSVNLDEKVWIDNIIVDTFNEAYIYWDGISNNSGKTGDICLAILESDTNGDPIGEPLLFDNTLYSGGDGRSLIFKDYGDYLAEFFVDVNGDSMPDGEPSTIIPFTINTGEIEKGLGEIIIDEVISEVNLNATIENNTMDETNTIYLEIYEEDGMGNPTGAALDITTVGAISTTTSTDINKVIEMADGEYFGLAYIDENSDKMFNKDIEIASDVLFEVVGGSTSPSSLYFNIEKMNSTPDTPILYGPPNTTESGIGIDIVLNIEEGSDPDGDPLTYEVYFGTDETAIASANTTTSSVYLANMSFNSESGLVDYQYTTEGNNVDYNTIYYWKVIVKDDRGGVTEGPVWSFITEPDTEVMGDLLNDTASDVKLEVAYRDTSTSPASIYPMMDRTETITSEGAFSIGFALPVDTYLATIYLDENGDGKVTEGEPKKIQEFEVFGSSVGEIVDFGMVAFSNPPEVPSYLAPEDMTTGIAIDVELSWNSVTDPDGDAVEYEVLLGEAGMTPSSIGVTTTTSMTTSALAFDTTYEWQVIARDEYGTESMGDIWSFTTSPEPVTLSGTIINNSGETGDVFLQVFLESDLNPGEPEGDPIYSGSSPLDDLDTGLSDLQYEQGIGLLDDRYIAEARIKRDLEDDPPKAVGIVAFEVSGGVTSPSAIDIEMTYMAKWAELGGTDGFTTGDAYGSDFTIDNTGTIFVTYADVPDSEIMKVFKYDEGASSWVKVGDSILDDTNDAKGFAISGQYGYPTVAYVAGNDPNLSGDYRRAIVNSYDGSSWNILGEVATYQSYMSENRVMEIQLFQVGERTIAAYSNDDGGMGGKLTVSEYDSSGNIWNVLGTANFTSRDGVSDIVIEEYSGDLYVGFTNRDGFEYNGDPTVLKYDSGANTWNEVGGGPIVTAEGYDFDFDITPGGELVALFENKVYRFNGTSWEQVGTSYGSHFRQASLDTDSGEILVAFDRKYLDSEGNFDHYGNRVVKYDQSKGEWKVIGDSLGRVAIDNRLQIESDIIDRPHIFYRDDATGKLVVKRYE